MGTRPRTKIAIGAGLALLAIAIIAWVAVHRPLAVDSDTLVPVPLSTTDAEQSQVGALVYRGGIDIPRMGQNIGGLSSLIWDADSEQLLSVTDDGRWVWIDPAEQDGQLTGITAITSGPLLGPDGQPLSGKLQGDSESITRPADDGWLIGFERDHRILRYAQLDGVPQPIAVDPVAVLGDLADNNGLETMAYGPSGLFLCAERLPQPEQPQPEQANCALIPANGQVVPMSIAAPGAIAASSPAAVIDAVPTDADMASDGTIYVLFRSYSPVEGNTAGIVAIAPDASRRDLASFRAPLSVDNFEGLALREEGGTTVLYIVSDDNFSGSQRTLLMKFEVLAASH